MSEIMKIFIGADKYGADFSELDRLRKISEKQGYTSYRHWVNIEETLGDYSLQNKSAILRGGYTGICIAHSAEFLLRNNISSVLIDLPYCRYDEKDLQTNLETINIRREDVLLGVRPSTRDDSRLKFIVKQ